MAAASSAYAWVHSGQAVFNSHAPAALAHPLATLSFSHDHDVWKNTLVYPTVAAAASAVLVGLQLSVRALRARPGASRDAGRESSDVEVDGVEEKSHIARHGGPVIFGAKVLRLLSCVVLLALSIVTTVAHGARDDGTHFLDSRWIAFGLIGTYTYASLLAFVSVIANLSLSRLATRHLIFVLLVTWGVYAYRDLWPLATFTLFPIDIKEGPFLWAKVSVLTLAAVVIPLTVPRQYIPVDPKNPMKELNPEQTASILSMAIYAWLDRLIWKGYRMPHLPFDELPPLVDSDETKHLVARSYKHLDPFQAKSDRHIFWGIMTVFRRDYFVLTAMIIIRVLATFASPIGIYQLLQYIESGGEGAIVRPWVWIVWLFLGPTFGAISIQFYIYIATRMMVQTQGIVTQLVFDHALRIRLKAETAGSPSGSKVSTAAVTPDNASVADEEAITEGGHEAEGTESTAVRASTISTATTAVGSGAGTSDAKKDKTSAETPKPAAEPGAASANLIGKINNLVTTDLNNLVDGRDFLFLILYAPLQISLSVVFLYRILGWSAFVGLVFIVLLFPVPGYVAALIQSVTKEKMKKTDARVENVTETMNVIRMIKLFGWEPRVADRIAEKRDDELKSLRRNKILELSNGLINFAIPVVVMIVTYITYTVFMKQQLNSAVVFSSMAVFDVLRDQLHTVFGFMPLIIQAKVSLDRLTEFLRKTELLDEFAKKDESEQVVIPPEPISEGVIGIREAAFTWSNDEDGTLTPGSGRRNFTLRIDDELTFKHKRINLVVGPTGSGKTSLLFALLGELHYIPSNPTSYVSLPRSGGVAYAAQESWVQSETIRENILFGAPYDEERYNKVIYQCALKRDLTLFDAGDMTEVGEKGLTLSGGQKARVTLARAVYSHAQILLLDDVLAALDVHTARWIVDKCFKGDLIRGRTVILVTHNIAMASPIADYVVSLRSDGRIASQGTLSKVIAQNKELSAELAEERQELAKAEDEVDTPEVDAEVTQKKSDGKLVIAEEIAEGHVGWPAVKLYFSSMGGKHYILFWLAVPGFQMICEICNAFQTWWLGHWAAEYETEDPAKVKVQYYMTVYVVLLAIAVFFYSISYLIFIMGSIRASRVLHKALVASVLGSTLRWLDTTPTSRIIARCTQDIQSIDVPLTWQLSGVIELTVTMLVKFIAVVIFSPLFLFPGIVVAIVGGMCGQLYIKAQLSVKREQSNARAPVLGHFGAAISGLTSIRAYGAQERFRAESYRRINNFTRAARVFYNLNRWVSVRIDALGALFAACLAAYLVYGTGVTASNIGFSLNMAVGFSGMILWWVRCLNEFEVNGNSVERIQQYLDIEHEKESSRDGIPPAYWPASGNLRVEKLSARYSEDGPRVLHEISFDIKSGERVGIVGRTGSGKSSLTLSLLRLINTEGKVYYDGIATDSVNLDALRSNVTIIPQVPELLSGTLRQNLDPFNLYDDVVLLDALRAAGLFSIQSESDEGRITLDSQISSGGGNLSVGQRQILALARAIVRQSKLLILDEATSAIDYETDTVIQTSLRKELGKDVTLLTIAHRLQTIMDADKIMVLDAGRIAEFGRPSELLKNEKGMLRALVDESGDRDALYEMAASAADSQ